ncbi:DNA-directed RNA polymerase III subunit RPC8 [Gossypium australe]|uniref:DNA-directed RNA polymerase subunit n=1 Tax=Gossypium australe TaxID=47621 RepID=A0A5B6WJ47_9ROSI|nr:DNA-directed RNA polymerase III subunit RPC8 [Gossypium australe]
MFYLSLIEHTLRLPPHLLHLPVDEAIKSELETLFLDKFMISGQLKVALSFPGDGASTYMVEFRLIVFRPFIGEIIVAKLKESDASGLRLSLGFFDDIYIPVHLLPTPSRFEAIPNTRNQGRRIWDFGDPEEAQSEEPRFVIDGSDPIKFRVDSVIYPSIPLEQPENSKPFAPMVITGTINYDGLGPVSWWEEAEMIQEDE